MGAANTQMSLFKTVHQVYAELGDRPVANAELYQAVADRSGIPLETLKARTVARSAGKAESPMTRTVRFAQQTMRVRGLLERLPNDRGVWTLTREGKHQLHRIERGRVLLGFSTRLGMALWADCRDAFRGLGEPVALVVSSPPYCLAHPRAYGSPSQQEFVDFICEVLEPLLRWLLPGGIIALNFDDLFMRGSPARSLIKERMVLALHDRLGLFKMGEMPWFNRSRAPGPVAYASIKRVHLNSAWEPVLWFTNSPAQVRSNNQRVLAPHTESHLRFIAAGGEKHHASYADGSHRLHPGRFSKLTAGRIPRDVLEFSHSCGDQRRYKAAARALGLPVHGAPFPLKLAEFLIKFMSEPGDLVVDPFGGSQTVGVAAEAASRRWITAELAAEYVRGGFERFASTERWINPRLNELFGLPGDDGQLTMRYPASDAPQRRRRAMKAA